MVLYKVGSPFQKIRIGGFFKSMKNKLHHNIFRGGFSEIGSFDVGFSITILGSCKGKPDQRILSVTIENTTHKIVTIQNLVTILLS